jgi:assimilatory nitrate reductase catalytic subunit
MDTADAVATHCPYCALQCAMSLVPQPVGAQLPVQVLARDFPTNRGGMCQKGWTSAAVLRAPDRLTQPLVRGADGELRPSDWDTALDVVAAAIRRAQDEHGPDAVAVFGGGGLTNEKAYSLGKFARAVLRTSAIDYNGRFCMSSAAAASNRAFGMDRGLPFPLADLGGAQAVLLVGSNLAETMPPAVTHLAGARRSGGLIVIDPRRSATAQLTDDGAGMHLSPIPGTDLVVLLAMLHVVFAESLEDREYLAARTTGADEVRRSVGRWWPERAEQVCGVPAQELREAARILAAASPVHGGRGAVILTGRGVEQSTQGTAGVTAAINLALSLGLPGLPHSGYGPITGQGNGQGGREHGQKSDQLPGYRSIGDEAARRHVAGIWGVDPATLPAAGKPAVQLLQSLGTPEGPKVLLVHGSNLVVSAPNSTSVEERLASLDLLVVCDVVPSETALLADVVLPVTQWAEEDGTMTSLEGRVLRRRRAVDPPAGVRSELQILAELGRRLRPAVAMASEPETVFDELAAASAGGIADYSGLSYAVLEEHAEPFWPAPPGGTTPRLFQHRFATPDGRARMIVVDHRGPADQLASTTPLFLVTGRVLQQYQSGAQTRRVPELAEAQPEPFVEIHPLLAHRLGAVDGDLLTMTTRRGSVRAAARLSWNTRTDTLFMPFHWSGPGSVNRATNDACDPISGMPEFKVATVAVSVEPVPVNVPHQQEARVP